jgi:hypothetical protein
LKPSGDGKSVSTGFNYTVYNSLEQLAKAMHLYSHSPSVYSTMLRYDPYSKQIVKQNRRRIHNISFVGNVLAYDFDNGSMCFKDACLLAEGFGLPTLIIRSKNDHKYDYDRFKMIVVTEWMMPYYRKDEVLDGFEAVSFERYQDIYYGFAKKFGFFDFMDRSTKDPSRLIARVTNSDEEKREYVIIGLK